MADPSPIGGPIDPTILFAVLGWGATLFLGLSALGAAGAVVVATYGRGPWHELCRAAVPRVRRTVVAAGAYFVVVQVATIARHVLGVS